MNQKTELNNIDSLIYGFKNQELNVIASRVGHGKTSLAISSVIQSIKDNKSVLYFSLDLTKEQITTRINDDIDTSKLIIDDTKYPTFEYIKNQITELLSNKSRNIKLVVIDYLQLIENDTNINISRELKKLAILFNVSIVLLSQLSVNIEHRINKFPYLKDLEDKNIEIDANLILLLWISEFHQEEDEKIKESESHRKGENYKSPYIEKAKKEAIIFIAKQINGKANIHRRVIFNTDTLAFEDKPNIDIDDTNWNEELDEIFDKVSNMEKDTIGFINGNNNE